MQLTGAMLVSAVCALAICFKSTGIHVGVVALALQYSLRLTDTLNALNREMADLQTQIVSVERFQQYDNPEICPQEGELRKEGFNPDKSWPCAGKIVIENVKMRYREDLPLVLDDISLTVQPGTSLGICGRTGSGKSSLLLSLMRLVEIESGRQMIDGVDIGGIGLHDLRLNLCVIPQDPVIFSGTVRFNLDPFGERTEEELNEAVKLSMLEGRFEGLDMKVSEGGGNFSHGIFCVWGWWFSGFEGLDFWMSVGG